MPPSTLAVEGIIQLLARAGYAVLRGRRMLDYDAPLPSILVLSVSEDADSASADMPEHAHIRELALSIIVSSENDYENELDKIIHDIRKTLRESSAEIVETPLFSELRLGAITYDQPENGSQYAIANMSLTFTYLELK